MSDIDRIQHLEANILAARDAYYNKGAPTVSDAEFDTWVDELKRLRPDSPAITSIGAPVAEVTGWVKARHTIPMGSLEKVQTPDEMAAWLAGCDAVSAPLLVSEKLDGISIHVHYVDGCFTQAITRGDGSVGEDITRNVARMKGIPRQLMGSFTGSLRGEIILPRSAMKEHFPDKVSARNAAAGTAKRYDGVGCEHLTVLFYKVADGKDFKTEHEQFEWLQRQGFQTPNFYLDSDVRGLWARYQVTTRDVLDYDIDGLVVALDDIERQITLGEKDGRPEGVRAFKFPAVARETTLREIVWQVGGTGRLTPVAIFDPVILLGAKVTQASLYNWKYITDLGLCEGSRIRVARANDVIPRVTEVIEEADGYDEPPSKCPSCGGEVAQDGEYLVCPNTATCPAQTVGRIKRYIAGLGVKEWGDTLIERLVEKGLVQTPADLYRLNIPSLGSLERITEPLADNLLGLLWEKIEVPLEVLLGSLSIPLCATSTIRMVMDAGFDTWGKIFSASYEDLQAIPGLGPVKSKALWQWAHGTGEGLMHDMFDVGVKVQPITKGVFTGLSFCFTGKSVRKRSELEGIVTSNGGVVKTSVGKGLSYLVMADPSSGSTKAKAAAQNGTKCISEDDLIRMVG